MPRATPDIDAADLLERLPLATWVAAATGAVAWRNAAARAVIGDEADWRGCVHEDDRARVDALDASGAAVRLRLRPSPAAAWTAWDLRCVDAGGGRLACTATPAVDADAVLRGALDLFPSPVVLLEPGTARVVFANRVADAMAGGSFARGRVPGRYHEVYDCTYPDGRRVPEAELPSVRIARGERVAAFAMDWRTHDGVRSVVVSGDRLPPRPGAADVCLMVFNDVTELKRADREQRVLAQRFSLLVDQAPFSIQILDPDGRTTRVNRAWLELWGIELAALHDYNLLTDPQLEAAGIAPAIRAAFAGDGPQLMPPIPYRPDRGALAGREIWTQAMIYPVKDDAGRVLEVVLVHQDITAARQREAALRERGEELERVNADLQQFAYVASHDLQEPVRMVSQFLGVVLRRAGDRLDDESRRSIGQALDGAKRMHALILDVLEFSRIGRDERREPVGADEALDEALANLGAAIADAGATIERAPLPILVGARSRLVQLFQNLVGNALKYRRSDRAPKVVVDVVREEGRVRVAVRDNGIGIEPEYRERVFDMFQRLHPRDQYAGSGVGLAICKRIVVQAGGRMWIEDGIDGGAAVVFTWPG